MSANHGYSVSTVYLFEYDKRFKAFGSYFHFYDYNKPEEIPETCVNAFSVVIADPPFLSEECLEKVAITVKKILKPDGKVLLCTGKKTHCETCIQSIVN